MFTSLLPSTVSAIYFLCYRCYKNNPRGVYYQMQNHLRHHQGRTQRCFYMVCLSDLPQKEFNFSTNFAPCAYTQRPTSCPPQSRLAKQTLRGSSFTVRYTYSYPFEVTYSRVFRRHVQHPSKAVYQTSEQGVKPTGIGIFDCQGNQSDRYPQTKVCFSFGNFCSAFPGTPVYPGFQRLCGLAGGTRESQRRRLRADKIWHLYYTF